VEQPLSTGALLREVARLHTQLQRNCVTFCGGTTVTQCTVLTELGRSGEVTLAELSHRIGFDKSWTSRAVEQLVQEGLVVKVPSQTDRRTVRVSLSALGQDRVQEVHQMLGGLADQALERIPAEIRASVHTALEWLQKGLLDLAEDKQFPVTNGGSSCTCV
jgi:DNA-binding MarR family transcriptional regulator